MKDHRRSGPARLVVGSYGAGLRPLDLDGGHWRLGSPVAGTENVSSAVFDPRRRLHFLVNENEDGRVTGFQQTTGGWTCLFDVSSGGAAPCFIALEAEDNLLAVANYEGGTITVYRLDPESGSPLGEPATAAHVGNGPNQDRQDGPHPHCVRFHQGRLYSVDLGADTVFARPYQVDPLVLGEPFVAFAAPPGQGPRQLVFHPSETVAYLLTELGSALFELEIAADGRLVERARHTTLPQDFEGQSLGGFLALNARGDRLYASNRGHDTIAVFQVAEGGRADLLQWVATGGASPRGFLLLEEEGYLVVAHEEGGGVSILPLKPDGKLGEVVCTLPVEKAAFVGLRA